jgi:hypothetical protein
LGDERASSHVFSSHEETSEIPLSSSTVCGASTHIEKGDMLFAHR